jgi:hypothetical protein
VPSIGASREQDRLALAAETDAALDPVLVDPCCRPVDLAFRCEPDVTIPQDVIRPEHVERGKHVARRHARGVGLDGRRIDSLPGLNLGVNLDRRER